MKEPPSDMPPSASVLQLLELALLTLQDGIAVLSSDGVLQYINKSAQQICFRSYGTTPAAGKYFFDFITDKKQAREACSSFERALRHQSSVRKVQVRIGDLESWFEMGYYPMAAENGTVSYVCATAKDITESVMLERKLTLQRQTQKNEVIRAALEAQGRERSFMVDGANKVKNGNGCAGLRFIQDRLNREPVISSDRILADWSNTCVVTITSSTPVLSTNDFNDRSMVAAEPMKVYSISCCTAAFS